MRSPSLPSVATALAVTFTLLFAVPAANADPFPAASLAPQVTAAPASPDNDLAPRWEFSAPDVGGFECSLSRDDTLVGDWAPCTSPAAYDLSSQPDGTYTFAVRTSAADGVVSDVATSQYVLDTTTPPQPTIVDLPGPVAANRTPAWTFAGGASEAFECRIDDADWAPCTSPYSVDLGDGPDGTYLFSVRGIAADGTPGPARTDSYLLDTTAPAAPEIDGGLPAASNATSAAIAFSAAPGAQVECRATGADATPDWAPCTSPYTFDLAGRPDGDYELALRATDAAGNIGPEATAKYTLDTTAPAAPVVDTPTATPATKLQPSFGFTGEPDATYECRLGDDAWLPCTSPAPYDLTGMPDSDYTFAVRATDVAGNTSPDGTATYHLARRPGGVNLRTGPGRVGNGRAPRWTFNVAGGSSFACAISSPTGVAGHPVPCTSPWTADLRGRPDADYSFTVTAAGDHDPVTQNYELDSTAPAAPALDAEPVSPAPDRDPAWHFSGEDGAALDCRVTRGAATVVDWTSCTNPREFDLTGAPDGDYQVTARARDAAGNVGPTVASDYRLDTTAPTTPALTAAPDATDVDRSPTWSFAGERDAVFSCTLSRGSVVVSTSSTCAGAKTYNLSGAEPGTYTFAVKATDAAGNTSPARVASYVLAKAPAVSSSGDSGDGSGSGSSGGGDGTTGSGSGSGPATIPPGTTTPSGSPTANGGFATGTTSAAAGPHASGSVTAPPATPAAGSTTPPGAAPGGHRPAGHTTTPSAHRTPAADHDRGARKRQGFVRTLTNGIGNATRGTGQALTSDVGRVVFPFSILVILGAFLLVQNRIDRRDPKLALAPIDADPDLEFGPPPARR